VPKGCREKVAGTRGKRAKAKGGKTRVAGKRLHQHPNGYLGKTTIGRKETRKKIGGK